MKALLTILIILQLVMIWFFFIKGNVKFTFGANRERIQTSFELPLPEESDIKVDPVEQESKSKQQESELVPKSTIRVDELKQALKEVLPEVLPQEVKKQVAEALSEKDTEFDDTIAAARRKFQAVDNIEKAFEDNRDSSLEGQTPAPPEDDETVPAFDDLDKSLKIISDKNASPEQKHNAMKVAVSVQDSNIIVALPEPLHSQLVDMLADYNAKEVDSNELESADSLKEEKVAKVKTKTAKKLPDNISDFNPADF